MAGDRTGERAGGSPTDPADPGGAAAGEIGPGVVCVVLAGGTGRRFGGDKTRATLGGTTVTGALVGSLGALPVVVVGSEAGGGPAAALAAALGAPDGPLAAAEVVVALAGDQPFAGTAVPRLVAALRAAPDGSSSRVDAVLGSDPGGRRQFLLAAYRAAPLRAALGTGGGGPTGRSMRSVVAGLRVTEIPVTAAEALDVDTADDLERARELAREPGREPARDELGSGA